MENGFCLALAITGVQPGDVHFRGCVMKNLFIIALATFVFAGAAQAQLSDPNMNCEGYLKLVASIGPTPKTGDAAIDKMAADADAKLNAYCKANPKANAMEAAQKILMGM
jgi:hypothetical protein